MPKHKKMSEAAKMRCAIMGSISMYGLAYLASRAMGNEDGSLPQLVAGASVVALCVLCIALYRSTHPIESEKSKQGDSSQSVGDDSENRL
ncbi:MAG: hypothetical protein ABL309_01770 [Phycisphaerales bacterium]